MPRHVRNFWVEVQSIDKKRRIISTGPSSKDGAIIVTIWMRENGKVSDKKLQITGCTDPDGCISLCVNGKLVLTGKR